MMAASGHTASGWPFLVARGRHTGYRTLLAPDFLTERRLHGQISDNARARGPGPHHASFHSDDIGPLTLIYRNDRLLPSDLDVDATNENALVTDEHGRPLEMLYGIVTRQSSSGPLHEQDLATARTAALNSYRRFLVDEHRYDVDVSTAFPLHMPPLSEVATSGKVPLQDADARPREPAPALPPPRRPHGEAEDRGSSLLRRHGGSIAVGGGVTIVIVILGMWLLRPRTAVEVLTAEVVPARGTVNCVPAHFELSATLRARRDGRVTYRWEPANLIDRRARRGTLNLRASEKRQITATAERPARAAKLTGSFRLVVDGQDRTLKYALRCATRRR